VGCDFECGGDNKAEPAEIVGAITIIQTYINVYTMEAKKKTCQTNKIRPSVCFFLKIMYELNYTIAGFN
jgi:hypothetical protein